MTEWSIRITKHSKHFGMKVPPEKSETMVFLRQGRVRCEIAGDNKCVQNVHTFKYLCR